MLGISIPGGSPVVMPHNESCQPRYDSEAMGYRMFCVRDTQALSGALAGVSDLPWWGWGLIAGAAAGISYGAFKYVRAARPQRR